MPIAHTGTHRKTGFTLIELLVVISIISLLVSILLPALAKARSAAQRIGCVSSVRQVNLSYFSYHADNDGYLLTYNNAAYSWDHLVLDSYISGGAETLFKEGCPGRLAGDTWSYGVNGAVHGWTAQPPINYYRAVLPARMEHFRKPQNTHLFADMIQTYKRYPNPAFFDIYLLDSTNRHNHDGISVAYADGHADFQTDGETNPDRIWADAWHYAYASCRVYKNGNGCFWHAYDNAEAPN